MAITDKMTVQEAMAWIEFIQWDRESNTSTMIFNMLYDKSKDRGWTVSMCKAAAKAAKAVMKEKHDANMQMLREYGGSNVMRQFEHQYRAEATKLWAKGWYWDKELEIMLNRP